MSLVATGAPVFLLALVLGACQAEQQTLDQGVRLDAPPAVEEAPATPIAPPAPIGPAGATTPGMTRDTLADTLAVPPR